MDAHDDIEQQLASLTEWTGGPTQLWRSADARKPGVMSKLLPSLGKQTSGRLVLVSGFAAILLIAVFWSVPHLGSTSRYADSAIKSQRTAVPANRLLDSPAMARMELDSTVSYSLSNPDYRQNALPSEELPSGLIGRDALGYAPRSTETEDADSVMGPPADMWPIVRASGITPKQFICPSTSNVPDPATDTSSDYLPARRFVIQNGTVELLSSDVSAAFMKVQQLIRAEAGEFIENSSLSGDAQNAQANLTLRVTANRLDDVLNELRKIGRVESEQLGGRDVTTEVVDVDARLRNEKRVEVELLELLESRKDSPLAELMQLRDALKNVRYSIESLVGRRDALSRMVSLATLLVIIRTNVMPEAPAPDSYWSYFGREMNSAWTAAIRFLADALATILRILVGGLPFWIGLVVLYVILQKRKT